MESTGEDVRSRHDVFISYSHAADGKLAPELQKALQRIARPWYRLWALRVYRDSTSLAITSELWPSIERALASSRYLILLASPEAAASAWVTKEVQWWLDHRSVDTLLIAVTGGGIDWNQVDGDFDWDVTTAVPAVLAGRFAHEPLWADLRFARTIDQLSLRHGEFKEEAVRLAAAVHGRPMDELESEDVRLHRRRKRLARFAVTGLAVLTIVAVVLGVTALVERDRARRSEAAAVDRLANLLASESAAADAGRLDPQRSLLLALTAAEMRTTEATRTALFKSLESQPYLTRILTGHSADKFISPPSSGINSLLYLPRSGELVSSGMDGRIIRWDPATGRRRLLHASAQLHGRGGRISLSSDGDRLLSRGGGKAVLWDMSAGRPDPHLNSPLYGEFAADRDVELSRWDLASWQRLWSGGYPRRVLVTAMGKTVVAGGGCMNGDIGKDACDQAFVQIWDSVSGQALGAPLVMAGKEVTAVEPSADGTHVAAGTRDGRIHLWDVARRQPIATWQGHTGRVNVIRFSPDGRLIATGGHDGRSVVWGADQTHSRYWTFAAYDSPVTAMAFSPNGRQLATGNELNVIMLWSLRGDSHVTSQLRDIESDPRSAAVSPDGKTLALGGANGIVTIVDRESRHIVKRLPIDPVCPPRLEYFSSKYRPCYLHTVHFNADGTTLVAAASSGNIGRWDTRTWAPLGDPLAANVPCGSLACDGKAPTAAGVAFGPGLNTIAVGGGETIWVWDLRTRTLTHTLGGHTGKVTTVAISSDGTMLASGGEDGTVLLWDLAGGQRKGSPMRHGRKVLAVAFQPGHNRLASNAGDNTVRIWDTDTQREVTSLRNDGANYEPELKFSPDGGHLATTTANYFVALWDTGTQTAFPRFTESTTVMAIAFDPTHAELVSVAKGPGENVPTFITTRGYDVAEWRQRACRIVPRNLDFRLTETYTLSRRKVCPDLPADGSMARHALDVAQSKKDAGDDRGAAAAYRDASKLVGEDDDVELAYLVCLHGAVHRHECDVLPACDRAVSLSPDSGTFRAGRSVARALAQDRTGAVDDLEFFMEWADSLGLLELSRADKRDGLLGAVAIARRTAWIHALRDGRDPLTAEVLDTVWEEYLQDNGHTYQTCPVDVGAWVEWVQRPTVC